MYVVSIFALFSGGLWGFSGVVDTENERVKVWFVKKTMLVSLAAAHPQVVGSGGSCGPRQRYEAVGSSLFRSRHPSYRRSLAIQLDSLISLLVPLFVSPSPTLYIHVFEVSRPRHLQAIALLSQVGDFSILRHICNVNSHAFCRLS